MYHLTLILDFSSNLWGKALTMCFSLIGLGFLHKAVLSFSPQLVNGWRDTTSPWHSETESYSYDGLDRLTSASCTSWSHTYSYDKVGNRTVKDGITYTINTANEVTGLSDGTSFTYDAKGNICPFAHGGCSAFCLFLLKAARIHFVCGQKPERTRRSF